MRGLLDFNIKANIPDFDISIPNFDISGLTNLVFHNKLIQGFGAGLGGVFSDLAGFGKKIPFPILPKISFPSVDISGMFGGIADTDSWGELLDLGRDDSGGAWE